MKIFIVFAGLIAQVNQPWSLNNTAVLPYAPHHVAEMRVPYQSIVDPPSWVNELKKEKDGNVVIPLEGVVVQVKGTRGVFSGLQKPYVDASIPMKTVASKCQLRDEVKKRSVRKKDLVAFIDYRGGRVYVDSYLKRMLHFNEPGAGEWAKDKCAVCRIHYEAELRGSEATLVITRTDWDTGTITTQKLRVKGGAHLSVSNKPRAAGPYLGGPKDEHYPYLYNIYRSCSGKPTPQIGDLCTAVPDTMICNLNPPDPGDDCTIVRHP